ncbi:MULTISPECIES: N(2)-acetyl-L-2,4-diaminobutanoate deacetylase DoeB [unclassified Ensifer]|uniref:N(2)-acetyl-L-2,4-diaminobutanoate deacetylase DoeB n=1 Tax=unclassified Ensifer TaxID=2633371 RepID=UPI000713A48B|nr:MULTISPECIES: N(2)-acetyl-L-2,4-diaminobutanoate deacetylase DoeB [unclassified Ensifer]KQX58162.1 N-alpha-acetyl diaminobutyric acid deacetylase DoeB [Ensifer sp. Root1298]KQX84166.1 N-alpha-acetyl diaminobutyric acid deacetylase DoeB [Ensifer sp. Root1312]KRC22392.1 N-alpha-acetyl diaminobutyric acid deacetylase DoeB [Ensifer sp. Root74]KRD56838.1 N-alpha-acetyl diaminobutyric acid deacetylase DoeB [Ensifer sp. Root954]MCY1745742.1 N(2)-acetyl-L-2,4-diaminobutanoate deacetylase DoeB [Ensi
MREINLRPSPISSTVDFSAEGVQHGFLRLPHSRDDSAWGSVMIPVTVVKNGEGPTALLTGGNHGDEYEGPIALFDLARTLKADDVTGRVIIVPAMNYPAFLAGTRTSPIDKGNMNRSFPGAPDGTVTQKIADYFQRTLLPLAEIVLDFHSGGKTLDFLPFCAAHVLPDKAQEEKSFELVRAFGAPWSMKMLEIDAVGMYDTAAEEMGKVFITTELGGGGTATARSARIAKAGVSNVLKAAGILKGAVENGETTWLDMPDGNCFCFAENGGLVEPFVDLGDQVRSGEIVARIYPIGRTGDEPLNIRAKMDGILVARHFPGLVKSGDCVSVLATIVAA